MIALQQLVEGRRLMKPMMALQQLVEGLAAAGSRPHAAPEAAGRRCVGAAARRGGPAADRPSSRGSAAAAGSPEHRFLRGTCSHREGLALCPLRP